jgi:hypothetical protein
MNLHVPFVGQKPNEHATKTEHTALSLQHLLSAKLIKKATSKMETSKDPNIPPDKPDKPHQGKQNKLPPTNGNGGNQPTRKKFKVSAQLNQPSKKAWQIKGENLGGGMLTFYLQKSIASKVIEQPFVRNLLGRLQKDEQLRVADMGILHFATRRGPDGAAMPSGPNQDDGWTMFVTQTDHVGSIGDWLEVVEQRLNDHDISECKDLFKWTVFFSCTSWGNRAQMHCLQDVIIDSDVARIVTGIHALTKPKNRENLGILPLDDYFHTHQEGLEILQGYLDSILEE